MAPLEPFWDFDKVGPVNPLFKKGGTHAEQLASKVAARRIPTRSIGIRDIPSLTAESGSQRAAEPSRGKFVSANTATSFI
jgi:hypothetical protein